MIAKMDAIDAPSKKQELTESASMNISMTADDAGQVGQLMAMMRNAGMDAKPVDAMHSLNPRADIEKFRATVDGANDDPGIPGQDNVPGDQDLQAGVLGTLAGGAAGAAGADALDTATGGVASTATGAMGAKAGAALGSLAGPAGAAIGGALGGIAGKMAPKVAGAAIGGALGDKVTGEETDEQQMEAGPDEISRDEVHNYAAKVLPAIADKIMSGKYSEDQVISLLLKKGMLDSKEFDFSGALVPTTNEASTEDTSYSIKGKSEEANAELARIANVDEWETDPEEHNQAAIESWHDEVVSAITDRNITFPIADNEIQKIADDVVDDWSNGNGPDEHTILSIIDNENSLVNQDQKDEATLEHEATLEAIRNISFR